MNTGFNIPDVVYRRYRAKNVNSFYAHETRKKGKGWEKDLLLTGLSCLIISLYTFTSAVFAVECNAQ